MKNADMPAMPQEREWQNDMEEHIRSPSSFGTPPIGGIGLTKREYFAATMNHDAESFSFGDLSNAAAFIGREIDADSVEDIMLAAVQVDAKLRVMRADALLAELEK